jgi:hypothetical protein
VWLSTRDAAALTIDKRRAHSAISFISFIFFFFSHLPPGKLVGLRDGFPARLESGRFTVWSCAEHLFRSG